jgi:DNA-binding NarL/FixJ family response regulator
MRAIIVGRRAERQGLRERLGELGHEFEIVAEYESLAEARASGFSADAILLAPPGGASDPDEAIVPEPLTAREIEVLELVSLGLSNKAVAERLGISDQTVKFHVGSITAKLGAVNRTDAVRRGVRQGLITL